MTLTLAGMTTYLSLLSANIPFKIASTPSAIVTTSRFSNIDCFLDLIAAHCYSEKYCICLELVNLISLIFIHSANASFPITRSSDPSSKQTRPILSQQRNAFSAIVWTLAGNCTALISPWLKHPYSMVSVPIGRVARRRDLSASSACLQF